MTRERVQVLGAAVALLVLTLLVLLDASISPEYAVLTSLFGLAPLIACAVVPPGATTFIAGLAVAAAALSGLWNDTLGTAQQQVRILNVILVSAAAVAISTARVRREDRFTQMSEIAQVAQRAILPILPTRAGNVAIAARYQSAARGTLVGGDLYDCYHSAQHIRLLVGDVRGKGISGVEQAARVIRAFRQSAALQEHLTQVAAEMDDYLADFFGEEEFVTVLLVDVTRPGVLQLVNSGHPSPQLVSGDNSRPLDLPAGLPLGLGLGRSADAYPVTTVPWSPGDRLLMYTDGLSEARDTRGEFFPVSSLADQLRSGSVEQAVDEVVATVSRHVPGGRLDDDLAVVVVEQLPVPAADADRGRVPRSAGVAGVAAGSGRQATLHSAMAQGSEP
ncbi:MAG TPA: PP2C family protein-serine/threonine phosphatase [Nocardioides sp.]|uniref:PP2C family protein-serine/threonine phosphatase n=1 Tax=Nocardioides sp. TaxID=35761 RepID=UPI002E349D6C|nr:PP2C family protein-serine/threonine phosphatase [Nocardioides sp.]HEX5086449.1 PP2C family protein-serine/threonine phosphatase [Nocardioides sp.]